MPSSASPEEKLEYIIRNTACVLRISESFDRADLWVYPMAPALVVPTRNTNYTHLRDAFVQTLQKRHWADHQAGKLSSDEQLKLQAPIAQLKSTFPNSPLAKGTPLDIVLTPPVSKQPRALIIRDLGAVQNQWVAQELILSFFDRQGNSPAVRLCVNLMLLNLMRPHSLSNLS